MIKNLNELLSLIVLVIITIFSLRILIWAFKPKNINEFKGNFWQLFNEYNDNEEE